VFAPGVSFCRGLKRDFDFWGHHAEVIHAETHTDDRDEIFERFNDPNDKLQVLISVDVLREGFDAPIASCVIDLQPNNQLRTVWQKWGRAKRAYAGQSEWVLIDMAGNWWRHIHPDDDPDWQGVTKKVSTNDLRKKKKKDDEPRRCPKCSEVWMGGLKCTACGFEIQESERVRHIRQGNGKLKEIVDKEKAPPSEWEKLLKVFQGCLYGGARGNKTLNQVRADFERRTQQRLPDNLPGLPPRGDVAWEYPSAATYPEKEIWKIVGRALKDEQQRRTA
jgi:superfamily II DNA or RNA helicase